MKKTILFLFPLFLVSCGPDTKTEEPKNIEIPTMSSEAPKTTPQKTHKASISTAKPETKEVTKELDNLIDEIAKSK